MAGSLNKVMLIGNLGADPEVRSLTNGGKVCNLSLATSVQWKDKDSGEKKERTEWHRVVIFNDNIVKVAENYLKKGSTVYVEGSLQTRKWTDQQGVEKYTTEIVIQRFNGQLTMLGGRGDSQGGGGDRGGYGGRSDNRGNDRGYNNDRGGDRDGGFRSPYGNGSRNRGGNQGFDNEDY